MFPDLLLLQSDQGASHLIRKETSGICIDFASPDLFMDVDTAEQARLGGIELDVHLSLDGKIIVCHDSSIELGIVFKFGKFKILPINWASS
jgi:hypothetical protein